MKVPFDPALLGPTLGSMSELLTSCALGYGARKTGLLDATTTRSLAKCVYNIFLPAMLSTSVSVTVASGVGLPALLPIPLAAWAQVGVGLLVARFCLLLLRIKPSSAEGGDVQVLSAFGNSGVLPLIFADSLFR